MVGSNRPQEVSNTDSLLLIASNSLVIIVKDLLLSNSMEVVVKIVRRVHNRNSLDSIQVRISRSIKVKGSRLGKC